MRAAVFAIALLAACASAPTPQTGERAPPLPPQIIDAAFAPARENDGGTRAQALAFVGREDLAGPDYRPVCAGLSVDPITEIVRQSVGHRVVIINEAHDAPRDRAFIADLATALRREGFSIYAAETLFPRTGATHTWPSINEGWYTREPIFAQLLRHTRSEGWRFGPYDDMSTPTGMTDAAEQMAYRETRQAENLQALLTANPDARMLVHVGYDHLLEAPEEGGLAMMAERLKASTSLDPLTIDQTRNVASGDRYVVCDPSRLAPAGIDIRLGSPRLTFADGRPAWRQAAGQKPVYLPAMANSSVPTIWEARRADESNDAVPIDRIMIRSSERLPFLLPPGRYRAESWSAESGWSASAIQFEVD